MSDIFDEALRMTEEAAEAQFDKYLEELEATVDRQRELLKRVDAQQKRCMFCHGWLMWIGNIEPENRGHTDDCELAKALVSERSDEELADGT